MSSFYPSSPTRGPVPSALTARMLRHTARVWRHSSVPAMVVLPIMARSKAVACFVPAMIICGVCLRHHPHQNHWPVLAYIVCHVIHNTLRATRYVSPAGMSELHAGDVARTTEIPSPIHRWRPSCHGHCTAP